MTEGIPSQISAPRNRLPQFDLQTGAFLQKVVGGKEVNFFDSFELYCAQTHWKASSKLCGFLVKILQILVSPNLAILVLTIQPPSWHFLLKQERRILRKQLEDLTKSPSVACAHVVGPWRNPLINPATIGHPLCFSCSHHKLCVCVFSCLDASQLILFLSKWFFPWLSLKYSKLSFQQITLPTWTLSKRYKQLCSWDMHQLSFMTSAKAEVIYRGDRIKENELMMWWCLSLLHRGRLREY